MQEKLLTIVTITYNRKEKLKRLYNSLINQRQFNFLWLVVDDGSDDGTYNSIKLLQETNRRFPIKIIKNFNIGKYKEINRILDLIDTELTVFVDSDDYLVQNGTSIIQDYWKEYCNDPQIGSLIFERGKTNVEPQLKINSELVDRRYYYLTRNHVFGDYTDVFVTRTISNYKFPEYVGEKFMTEGPLYYWFSQNYNSVFIPKIVKIGEYGELTLQNRRNQINNYQGSLYETSLYLNKDTPFLFRIKKGILYNFILLCSEAHTKDYIKKSNHKVLLFFCSFPAMVLSIKYKLNSRRGS